MKHLDNSYLSEYREHSKYSTSYWARMALVKKYAWAIPDKKTLSIIAEYSPIVEMGAGTGYWAYLLSQLEVEIIAFDRAPVKTPEKSWFPVRYGYPSILKKYGDKTLFLCWPPYDDSSNMSFRALESYPGNTVIYIGEGLGGCTGTDEFHESLENNWDLLVEKKILQWKGLHDRLYIYTRKGRTKIEETGK